ncbi:MAG: metal ABC transporter ATP-binding protein [Chloroflexi bacterium]|nr:metal ABC transporter ATP-binding protein [Chloroflexota bacterium]
MLHTNPHPTLIESPLVEIRGLAAGYRGARVVEDVSLDIMRNDFAALLGPSGSGKTTVLRAIVGAADVYAGDVLFRGVPVGRGGRARPRIGYVPQLEAIDWNFPVTVEQVVLMGATRSAPLFPWFRRSDRLRAGRVIERLGLEKLANRQIRELSGGQQQRVFLGRALVSEPEILLLDEPTAGVDIKTRDDVLHLLDELNHQGIGILMTTHEINAVAAHLPRVICMNGRIIADGTPRDVLTPDVLRETYGAEMPVTEYRGMTLVAETPHRFGAAARNGSASGRAANGHVHGDNGHVHEDASAVSHADA